MRYRRQLYTEQKEVNRAFLVKEINVALPLAESRGVFVSSTELRERVTELLDSEEGKDIRERTMKLRDDAATTKQGTPSLDYLVQLAHPYRHI